MSAAPPPAEEVEQIDAVLFRHDAQAPEWVRVPKGDALLDAMYRLIGCEIVEPCQLSDTLVLYMDEDARQNENADKPNTCFHKFTSQPMHTMFLGNVLLLKCDAETGEHDESVTQTELDSLVDIVQQDVAAREATLRDLGLCIGGFFPTAKAEKTD